jgi:S1-C subfamily serine protease
VLPVRTAVAAGDLLFTTEGALAGLVVPHAGMLALVPGETLLGAVDLLRSKGAAPAGWLGVEVHGLSPSLATATGAHGGVIVSRVHPEGPAAAALAATDVIEAVNREPIASMDAWQAIAARVRPGGSVELTVRRRGGVFNVTIIGAAPPAPSVRQPLGLTLRTVARLGAEVVEVASQSAAARAGILAGDVIVAIGDIQRPTAVQVTRAFAGSPDRSLLAVIARGDTHRVVALTK